MSFYFYDVERIRRDLQVIEQARYTFKKTITQFTIIDEQGARMIDANTTWTARDQYLWIDVELEVTEKKEGEVYCGQFNFGRTAGGNTGGFEGLVYLNGTPFQAIDSNHEEVLFYQLEKGNYNLKIHLWSGLDNDDARNEITHVLKPIIFSTLNKTMDSFYYLLKNALQILDQTSENNPQKYLFQQNVYRAVDFIDTSELCVEDVEKGLLYLQEAAKKYDKLGYEVSLIGHSHIDVAWLWRIKHTKEKSKRTFTTVDHLMGQYENYHFLQSQAQLYEYMELEQPETFEIIKQRIQENKWEPGGCMWVESDCNLISGESIVRQILFGKKYFKEKFNKDTNYLWLPDVFGYSVAMPQILKLSNIDTFITTKISWNDTNRLPYDTFDWVGLDGSSVLTHFITATDNAQSTFYTYNGVANPETILQSWNVYQNKAYTNKLLVAYGYGDGGGGVNREMLENINAMEQLPFVPQIHNEHPSKYVEKLHIDMKNHKDFHHPKWDGELYLEFHRGTYTSQAFVKYENRKLENKLRWLEYVCTTHFLKGEHYPTEQLEYAWKKVLCNQFHDIIPGSSIKEVYEDVRVDYKEVNLILDELLQTIEAKGSVNLSNDMECDRNETIVLDGCFHVTATNIKTQFVENNRTYLYVEALKGLSIQNLTYTKIKNIEKNMENKLSFENQYYEIEFSENGAISKLYDKEAKKDFVQKDCFMNELVLYNDRPREFDAWELESTYKRKKEVLTADTYQVIADHSLLSEIVFTYTHRNTTVIQNIVIYHNEKRIDFKTNIDWQEKQKMCKVLFPVDIRTRKATYDIQFGNIERETTKNTSWEMAKYEVVGHKWVNIEQNNASFSLINDGKYGHHVEDSFMGLTLLKSSNYPDHEADRGIHEFTYAITSSKTSWRNSDVDTIASRVNQPLHVELDRSSAEIEPWIFIKGQGIRVDAIKKAENSDHLIVRFHEYLGGNTIVEISSLFTIVEWAEVNLLEEIIVNGENEILVPCNPYEIKTIIISIVR